MTWYKFDLVEIHNEEAIFSQILTASFILSLSISFRNFSKINSADYSPLRTDG